MPYQLVDCLMRVSRVTKNSLAIPPELHENLMWHPEPLTESFEDPYESIPRSVVVTVEIKKNVRVKHDQTARQQPLVIFITWRLIALETTKQAKLTVIMSGFLAASPRRRHKTSIVARLVLAHSSAVPTRLSRRTSPFLAEVDDLARHAKTRTQALGGCLTSLEVRRLHTGLSDERNGQLVDVSEVVSKPCLTGLVRLQLVGRDR